MDQCSWHDTPPALSVNLTDWLGHDLGIELKVQGPTSTHQSVARWKVSATLEN